VTNVTHLNLHSMILCWNSGLRQP